MPPPTIALPANLAPLRDAANLLQDVLDARDDKSSPLAGLWDGPRLPATSSGTTDSSGGSTPSGGGSTPTTDAPTRYREQFQQSLLEAMAGLQTLLAGTGKNAPLAPAPASGGEGGSASLLATEHCGEFLYANDFESPVGAEWSNTTTDTTPTGGRSFLGQFGNQTVSLTLTCPPSRNVCRILTGKWLRNSLLPSRGLCPHEGRTYVRLRVFGDPGATAPTPAIVEFATAA
jgi:hypothetical protein